MIPRSVSFAALFSLAVIAAKPVQAQPVSRPWATDIAVGVATTHGQEVAKSSTFAADVVLTRTIRRFGRIGGALGLRSAAGMGDVCVVDPADTSRCLDRVSRQMHAMALGGLGFGDGSAELRLLAGPLLIVGDRAPAFGGAVAADASVGSQVVAVTFGARASTAHRRQGGRLSSQQWTLGLRLRY